MHIFCLQKSFFATTILAISSNTMIESVFIEMLQNGIVNDVTIVETLPSKGKPAKKSPGTTTVWTVKIVLNNDEVVTLESARGGNREWASLDNLTKWLRTIGISKYSVLLFSKIEDALQEKMAFVTHN